MIISVLVIAALLVVSGGHPPSGAAKWLRPGAVVAALVIAVGGGLIIGHASHLALTLRFARSAPAFDAQAVAAGSVPTTVAKDWLPYPGECPRRIGSYEIAECHAFTGGFLYVQKRNSVGDEAGFAYAPNGLPAEGSRFTHLVGPWYAWS